MDAVTVAAALAIVVGESQETAMREVLLERERLAMTVADRDSYLAQRHHVISVQRLLPEQPMTWQDAYDRRHADYLNKEDVTRAALRALRRGDSEAAERHLTAEVGSDSEADEERDVSEADATDGETEEEEEAEEDVEVEPS